MAEPIIFIKTSWRLSEARPSCKHEFYPGNEGVYTIL